MSEEERNIFRERITKGVKLAVQRLIDRTKKEDGELVYSQNGKVVRVKARSLN